MPDLDRLRQMRDLDRVAVKCADLDRVAVKCATLTALRSKVLTLPLRGQMLLSGPREGSCTTRAQGGSVLDRRRSSTASRTWPSKAARSHASSEHRREGSDAHDRRERADGGAGIDRSAAHVFEGVNRTGVNPDLAGVLAGVTTVVDAGSAGAATFAAFPRHVIPNSHTEVVPFLHICQTGLATNPDIIAESSVDLDETLQVMAEHKGLIRGIKARMVSPALEIMGMRMPELAKRAARESGTRLMVHIGDTAKRYDPNVIRSCCDARQGRHPHALLSRRIRAACWTRTASWCRKRARRRTAACGSTPRTADELQLRRRPPLHRPGPAPALHQHDLTVPEAPTPWHSMVEIMTRFLGLGFSLAES